MAWSYINEVLKLLPESFRCTAAFVSGKTLAADSVDVSPAANALRLSAARMTSPALHYSPVDDATGGTSIDSGEANLTGTPRTFRNPLAAMIKVASSTTTDFHLVDASRNF